MIGLFIAVLAVVFALLEIEIEGKNGWAEKLPTWKAKPRWWKIIGGAKPLTGYHFFMLLFVLLMFHLVFFFGLSFTIFTELHVIAYFIIFFTVEDFLWFVLNPAFTVKRFTKKDIWWHAKTPWVFGTFPVDYLNAACIALILITTACLVTGFSLFVCLTELVIVALCVAVVVLYAPMYHHWYKKMHSSNN